MIVIAIIWIFLIVAVIILVGIVIKNFYFMDLKMHDLYSAKSQPRQKTSKPPKPKKVKEPKRVKQPKKAKEPKRVKQPKSSQPKAKAPASSSSITDAQRLTKIKQTQHQIASIHSMIRNIDTQFQAGSISQQEYLQKKSFLSEKLGGLQAELDQLRS